MLKGFFETKGSDTSDNDDDSDGDTSGDNSDAVRVDHAGDDLSLYDNPMKGIKSKCPNIQLNHINSNDYDSVYEPGSDTYLLMDCIESDLSKRITKDGINKKKHYTIMEVGCGSGIVSAHTYNVIKYYSNNECSSNIIAVDININALKITQQTLLNNGIKSHEFELILSNLLSCIHMESLSHSIDVLIFNPPYVPTTHSELIQSQHSRDLSSALSGGINGTAITYQILPLIQHLLSKNTGIFYLVSIDANKPHKIMDYLSEKPHKLLGQIIGKKRVTSESLSVLQFTIP